MEVEILTDPLY